MFVLVSACWSAADGAHLAGRGRRAIGGVGRLATVQGGMQGRRPRPPAAANVRMQHERHGLRHAHRAHARHRQPPHADRLLPPVRGRQPQPA
eukprot:4231580-Pyramimonas_sp.AAC.1